MMRAKGKPTGVSPGNINNGSSGGGGESRAHHEWEMRPGGMLVQKRTDSDQSPIPPPMIRVRVKYGAVYHEMNINSQATFGELKKMLSGPTGLHYQDQKLLFKDKERDSKSFLDITGVKDRSKMVLLEDPISQEKRLLEMRKTAKIEKSSKAIAEISLEVDRLAGQVSALELIINKGAKVAEKDLITPVELLMNQLLKLDGIMGDGDIKLQRKMQVTRVQKYVETLDMLKVKNSMLKGGNKAQIPTKNQKLASIQEQTSSYSNGNKSEQVQPLRYSNGQRQTPIKEQQSREAIGHLPIHQQYQRQQQQKQQLVNEEPATDPAVATKWEIFDSIPPLVPVKSTSATNNQVPPRFNWEFFD